MKPLMFCLRIGMPAGLLLLFSNSSQAVRLVLEPDVPLLLHAGAAVLLYSHIGAATIGMIAGLIAASPQKVNIYMYSLEKYFLFPCLSPILLLRLLRPFLKPSNAPILLLQYWLCISC